MPNTISHDRSCNAQAIGRRVLAIIDVPTDPEQMVTLGWLLKDLDPYRTECTCVSRNLNRINEALRLARKGARAGRAGCAQEVNRLLEERDGYIAAVSAEAE